MRKSMLAAASAALCSALILGLAGCGAASPAASGTSAPVEEVTVSASGTVRLTPDKASVTFGVTTQETSAELAQSKNSEAVQQVMDVLTGRGIEEKSIRTVNYSMYPQYDYSEFGEQRIIGYVVYTTMRVEDQEIDDLGRLLSACVAAGINSVDNVSFFCSGYDEAYRQALGEAVEASRVKAGVLAAAAGKTLGEALSITEGWQDTSARYARSVNAYGAMKTEAAMDMAAPSFQPGETEITANVTVSYRMQ